MSNTLPITLRIGTRGSDLALYQADVTEAALGVAFPEMKLERRIIKTTGDRRTDVALSEVAKEDGVFDKGVFIKEIEQALEDGTVDLAVHSLKDMPTELEDGFALAAVLPRGPVRDVLISRDGSDLMELPEGARVGTSSPRRAKQAEYLHPDLKIVDLRGNVPTRLEKLARGEDYDAILLAEAGLVRLGYLLEQPCHEGSEALVGIEGLRAVRLPENEFYPAAGQGAIGLEIRWGDKQTRSLAKTICHDATWTCITAEREFLRLLDAGCHTPVGVYSTLKQGLITMKARVFPEAGGQPKTSEAKGDDPYAVAQELFDSLP
ncbi:MAG: hydroxymethylbilane synthase [Akkermansiaceae bacterium]|nr:hydroxymethylbilane synthase [Akkermansiaceae bacterium]